MSPPEPNYTGRLVTWVEIVGNNYVPVTHTAECISEDPDGRFINVRFGDTERVLIKKYTLPANQP